MKKRILGLLMVVCLVIGLLPVVALAEEAAAKPVFRYTFATNGNTVSESVGSRAVTMNAGAAAKYYITKANDANYPDNRYMVASTEAEWNVKVEYPADGIPTITLKGAEIINLQGLWVGSKDDILSCDVKLVVEEDSTIQAGLYHNALGFLTTGTATITGKGKLTINTNTHAVAWGTVGAMGNLVLDNANVEINHSEAWSISNAIAIKGGDLIVKGGKLRINGYDDPNRIHENDTEGAKDFSYNGNAIEAAFYVLKDEAEKGGNILVEGGADVYVVASTAGRDSNVAKSVVTIDGKFTIKDSTVELGMPGTIELSSTMFSNGKPVLEFTDNAYTTAVTRTKQPKYMENILVPAADKYVDWASTTALASVTYFKVYPGGNGGSFGVEGDTTGGTTTGGTTTGGSSTNPGTGDMNIALVAAVAFAAAVSFAGVTIFNKKHA